MPRAKKTDARSRKSTRNTKAHDNVAQAGANSDTDMNVRAMDNVQEHVDLALAAQKGSRPIIIRHQ
jgi:hypothetical protein